MLRVFDHLCKHLTSFPVVFSSAEDTTQLSHLHYHHRQHFRHHRHHCFHHLDQNLLRRHHHHHCFHHLDQNLLRRHHRHHRHHCFHHLDQNLLRRHHRHHCFHHHLNQNLLRRHHRQHFRHHLNQNLRRHHQRNLNLRRHLHSRQKLIQFISTSLCKINHGTGNSPLYKIQYKWFKNYRFGHLTKPFNYFIMFSRYIDSSNAIKKLIIM